MTWMNQRAAAYPVQACQHMISCPGAHKPSSLTSTLHLTVRSREDGGWRSLFMTIIDPLERSKNYPQTDNKNNCNHITASCRGGTDPTEQPRDSTIPGACCRPLADPGHWPGARCRAGCGGRLEKSAPSDVVSCSRWKTSISCVSVPPRGFHFDCFCAASFPRHMVPLTFNYDNIKVFVLYSPFM